MMWMDLGFVIQSKVSQKEKQLSYIVTHTHRYIYIYIYIYICVIYICVCVYPERLILTNLFAGIRPRHEEQTGGHGGGCRGDELREQH